MKIAYLSQSTLPSQEANAVHVMKMCQALGRHGHDVTLYACTGATNNNIFSLYSVDYPFKVKSWKIPKIHGRFILLAMTTFFSVAVKKKPSLIYARGLFSLSLCALFPVKFIYEAHSTPRTQLHFILERRLFRRDNLLGVVTINNALKREYLKLYDSLNDRQVFVAADAADLPQSTESSMALKGKPNVKKIVYTGSLHKGKGIEIILPLSALLPDIEFHIIGGNTGQILSLASGQNSPQENVFFYGHIDHSSIHSILEQADILIAPYLHTVHSADGKNIIGQWMSPMKIFEYMSAGKPIISSDIPAIREIIQHNHNGLLCDPSNLESWAAAILSLIKNPDLATNIALQCHNDFLEKYTWEARAKNILEHFNLTDDNSSGKNR